MAHNYTMLSQKAWDDLSRADMTPGAAAAYLLSGLPPRTLNDLVRQLAGEGDLRKRLVDGLCACSPDANPDSIARKVRNWIGGQKLPDDRETLFQIAFSLGFSPEQADQLLATTTESAIHLRNPRELVYAYCLREGHGYQKAVKMADELAARAEGVQIFPSKETVYTKIIREGLSGVTDDASLASFYMENLSAFSSLHNTGYDAFRKLLRILTIPQSDDGSPAEKAYAVERVVDDYLRMRIPPDRKTAKLPAIKKVVRRFWPNATQIGRILAREEDVTRKSLLLLYIATEGIYDNTDYDEFDEDYITPDDMLEEHCWRINLLMDECGLGQLDPRAPFDWVILYALRHAGDEGMSERMEAVIAALFAEGGNEMRKD